MKTLHQIKDEMNSIQVEISTNSRLKKINITALKRRYAFLKTCYSYIESSPDNDFLLKEKARLANKITLINKGYKADPKFLNEDGSVNLTFKKQEKKERSDYNKLMFLPKWRGQLLAINFLLN